MARTLINSFKGCAIIRLRSHTGIRPSRSTMGFFISFGTSRTTIPVSRDFIATLASYSASLSRRWLHRSTFANREIEFWVALGLPGVTEDAFKYAVEQRNSITSWDARSGPDAQSMDPTPASSTMGCIKPCMRRSLVAALNLQLCPLPPQWRSRSAAWTARTAQSL